MTHMVSVVIPVYNAEKYLHRCLDSVVNQTYKDIEIVLVDDGSTDGSGAICDDFARRYDNIVVQHRENMGPSVARNYGISISSGDYLMFIDSDDELSALELISENMQLF